MTERCPYCGSEYVDSAYLFRHAMTDHREAVLAHWLDEHDVTPLLSGQQQIREGQNLTEQQGTLTEVA
jgi:hypothetical protein